MAAADAAGKGRRPGRPSKAEPFRALVGRALAEDPHLLSLEILRRARLAGYTGGKSALYALVASLRAGPTRRPPSSEPLPGERSRHDLGHADACFAYGSRRRLRVLASRLAYSRWSEVTVLPDERVETVLRALVDHFAAFGGTPLLAVFGRPRVIALRCDESGAVAEWDPTFAGTALDLGFGVEVDWPRRADPRRSGGCLVRWAKGAFFAKRRFVDEADLAAQLAAWRLQVNAGSPCPATGAPPSARMDEERARLRPLKVAPAHLALRVPVLVDATGYVLHETHRYSMPRAARGSAGTLFLHRDHVRIVAASLSAVHPRGRERGAVSTLPEHLDGAQGLAADELEPEGSSP